jgi:ubiquinone/menaquinone biosynthesis C-methylase UbiE
LIDTKETSRRYFDEKVEAYADESYVKIKEKYPTLYIRHKYIIDMIEENEGLALDVGCGPGVMLIDLTKKGYDTIGVDISKGMIEKARRISLKHEINASGLIVADIENLPFKNGVFDLIVCAGVIEYLDSDQKALTEISRILKPKGTAFVSVTNALTPFWIIETVAKISGLWPRLLSIVKGVKPPKARVHIPHILSKIAKKIGLKETGRAYFDFTILPFPLGFNNPNLRRRIGFKMERLSRKRIGVIGRGCVMRFVKKH